MKKLYKELGFSDMLLLACLAGLIVIVPLVVRMAYSYPTPEEMTIRSSERIFEAFSYYKSILLLIFGFLIVLFRVTGFFIGETKWDAGKLKTPFYLFVGIYSLLVILSTVFSSYKQTAVNGIVERYESVFVLLVYMVILVTAKDFVKDGRRAGILLALFMASAFVIGIIGAFQAFGMDFFLTDVGKRLVLGEELYAVNQIRESFGAVFTMTYATLYNPNCVGLYTAFLAPVFFFCGVFGDKKKPFAYIAFFLCALMLICLYGSDSEAGYVGFLAAVVAAVIVCGIYIGRFSDKGWVKLLYFGVVGGLLLIGAVAGVTRFDQISAKVASILNLDGSKFNFYVKDIKLTEDGMGELVTQDGSLYIAESEQNLTFDLIYNGQRLKPLTSQLDEETQAFTVYTYQAGGIGPVKVSVERNVCMVEFRGIAFSFMLDNGRLVFTTNKFKPVELDQQIPAIGFKDMEGLATGRGFIWSRSIPLLAKNLLIGGGPDSFAYQFPQEDVMGKLHNMGNPYMIVDKPHNTYLQIGINTGVLSLLALLALYAYYAITSLKALLAKRMENRFLFGLALGLLSGICGYLVCSLSTDSTVSVSPVFFAGLGLAFGVNQVLIRESNRVS